MLLELINEVLNLLALLNNSLLVIGALSPELTDQSVTLGYFLLLLAHDLDHEAFLAVIGLGLLCAGRLSNAPHLDGLNRALIAVIVGS